MVAVRSVRDILVAAQNCIGEALGLETATAQLEARLLLQRLLKCSHAWLIAHASEPVPLDVVQAFEALLQRRLNGEPIAYILGQREFYGLELQVTPATLIPRPDTEILVEAALEKIPLHHACAVLDLGIGSGAIALALAKHRPRAQVTGVELSLSALAVATHNAQQLKLSNTHFLHGHWFSTLAGMQFDVIVSNPPYIAQADAHLERGDLRFEPRMALASGEEGLQDLRHIIAQAPKYLRSQGWLLLEHGHNQAVAVAQLLRQAGFRAVSHVPDLSGVLRVTMGRGA